MRHPPKRGKKKIEEYVGRDSSRSTPLWLRPRPSQKKPQLLFYQLQLSAASLVKALGGLKPGEWTLFIALAAGLLLAPGVLRYGLERLGTGLREDMPMIAELLELLLRLLRMNLFGIGLVLVLVAWMVSQQLLNDLAAWLKHRALERSRKEWSATRQMIDAPHRVLGLLLSLAAIFLLIQFYSLRSTPLPPRGKC